MKCPEHNLDLLPIDVGMYGFIMRYKCPECGFWFLDLKQLPLTEWLENHLNLDNVPEGRENQVKWLKELDEYVKGDLKLFRVTHKR